MIQQVINRVSCAKLTAPAPSSEQMEQIFQAALRAPDHRGLKPWQYLVYQGEDSLNKLGDILLKASLLDDPELAATKIERIPSLPLRAPMVIVAIAKACEHEKVPHIEEIASTSAGVQNMLLAASDLGFGAYWRTGGLAYSDNVKKLLEMRDKDTIVGFIYLGTPQILPKAKTIPEVSDFVSYR